MYAGHAALLRAITIMPPIGHYTLRHYSAPALIVDARYSYYVSLMAMIHYARHADTVC